MARMTERGFSTGLTQTHAVGVATRTKHVVEMVPIVGDEQAVDNAVPSEMDGLPAPAPYQAGPP